MRIALIAVTTALVLVGACRDQAPGTHAQNAAAGNAAGQANAAGASGPLGAAVTGERAKKLMHERHEGMEEIGDAFKLVSREVKESSPDRGSLGEAAATIARLAPKVTTWFPPGTGPDVGKTRAKAEIWQKPEDFAAKRAAFQKAAPAFQATVQGGDLAAIRAAHAELGKTCKACHDLYRAEEDEHE